MASKEVFVQKNLNLKWEEQLKLLQEDAEYAKNFTKFILADTLNENVEVEAVSVYPEKSNGSEISKVDLEAIIVVYGYRRTMKISLYKNGYVECDKSFKCCYYCVEAPSILLDSRRTSINLELREDLLERWSMSIKK